MILKYTVEVVCDKSGEVVQWHECGANLMKATKVMDSLNNRLAGAYTARIDIQELKQCSHTNQTA